MDRKYLNSYHPHSNHIFHKHIVFSIAALSRLRKMIPSHLSEILAFLLFYATI